MANDIQTIVRRILKDIRVELTEEFDKNFARQAFFSESWARRKSPTRPGGHILVDNSDLRKSIMSTADDSSITFSSSLPYAEIHNEGGTIAVTAKMKNYFWRKYIECRGSFGRRKDGSLRKDKRTIQLSTEAEFWKMMALMKVGKKIVIPRRRFLGTSPEVEKMVREIIEENLDEYFKYEYKLK